MKLHIGNISKTLTEPELTAAIVPFAQPSTVEIVRDQAGASRGYGFAEFSDDDAAKAVIKGLDGTEIAGQVVKIGEARPRKGSVAAVNA